MSSSPAWATCQDYLKKGSGRKEKREKRGEEKRGGEKRKDIVVRNLTLKPDCLSF
jgi:hypothetical protein